MELIKEVLRTHVDHWTGKITERKMYKVGDKEFETREIAAKELLTNWVVDTLNANADLKKQLEDLGRNLCIHLSWTSGYCEWDWLSVLGYKSCDPDMKRLAKDAIALRSNPWPVS